MRRKALAGQWSRAALALSVLFASLPLANRLFLGAWGFEGALDLSVLCLAAGGYLALLSRRRLRALRDDAENLERALRLASAGESDKAITLLTAAIRRSPRLWQAYQYRGELYLREGQSDERAVDDFSDAIRLAPGEAHLYALRAQAHERLGQEDAAREDQRTAATLRERELRG